MSDSLNHDLLTEPLLSVRPPDGEPAGASLPEVLARLGAGEEIEFPRLQPHQQHPWHAFLVQLAALVAHGRGDRDLALSTESWRRALLDLTGGAEAWHLQVADLSRPAFLQNPVPEGTLDGFKDPTPYPDDVDRLLVSRNHDLKTRRIAHPEPEHWAFALLSLQTMEGFMGRGNFGIARMNGGFASRPMVTAAPDLSWPDRFARDTAVWLDARPELTSELYGYPEQGGLALLWTVPWDGEKESTRPLAECDPFFIEVCRRVRLTRAEDGALVCVRTNTKGTFLDAKAAKGNTGDVWVPVDSSGKGLTVPREGFSYRRVTDLVFGNDYPRKPGLVIRDADGPEPLLVAQVLVRGQGQTEGFHQRVIRVPRKVRPMLVNREQRDELGAIAKQRVERASVAERKVLHPALCALLQGGRDSLDLRDRHTGVWIDRMDRSVDAVFFDDLWEAAELSTGEAQQQWDRRLYLLAREVLEQAIREAPTPGAVELRGVARAQMVFGGAARNNLSGAFPERDDDQEEEETRDDAA